MDLDPYRRVLVVAAHPDDETLGAAGLVARACGRGLATDLVVITAGEHSHPASPTHSPTDLSRLRTQESGEAWRVTGSRTDPVVLGVEDGTVGDAVEAVTSALVERLGDGRRTLVLAPWRRDGHPDHEAAGRAAAAACRRTGAELLEYPVWFWHWADPAAAPWEDFVTVALDPDRADRKARAIQAHRTQVAPLSGARGDETLLLPSVLAHFSGPVEVFVDQPAHDGTLERLHARETEPWGADDRWYEQRKRELVLACLPAPTYSRGLEVGCSTGVLTAALARRCESLHAVDASPSALARAGARLAELPHVSTALTEVPQEWPEGRFDLVVVSELGYFLSPVDLELLAVRIAAGLTDAGCVLLCHWRHPVRGWVLDGPEVHRRLAAMIPLPEAARYVDRDVEIVLLAGAGRLPDPGA